MFTRKLLEISLFLVYWVGFAWFAIVYIYFYGLAKPFGWDKDDSGMQWPTLVIFIFILVIVYVLVRYLALWLYSKCKIQETRLMAKTKQKIRLIKENSKKSSSSSYGGSTNLTFENEKLKNQEDLNNNEFKRFLSLNNITKPVAGTIMKNGKSLDTVLSTQEGGAPQKMHSKSLEQLIDIYEKPEQTCNNDNNQIEKFQKYGIISKDGKIPIKYTQSAENLLDYDKAQSANHSLSAGNLINQFENNYDVCDGSNNSLRRGPRVAPQQQQQQHRISATLPRKKVKRLAPAPPGGSSTLPRLHQQHSRMATKPPLPPGKKPILLKNVLVSQNAKMLADRRNSKNLTINKV